MSDEPDDPLIGQTLNGRFEILEPIGIGGMGRVYKAIQHPLERVVALKVLNPRYDGAKDPGFEKRFFLEASMTAKLKHPNTITVHDYGRTDDGIYYLAMEYVEGETLQQLTVREGPLPWPRALAIGAQVARSLREAHKLGLVHRDLKPANIMLISEGPQGDLVKVLDFGLVKSVLLDPPAVPGQEKSEITMNGVLLGSPLYMAPEQARNQIDARTDIYSLGVVLYQAIAGRTPFRAKESIDVIIKHIRERPPELSGLAEVPIEVNALIMKCLEKSPAARFQTMEELLEGLRTAGGDQGFSGVFVDPRFSSPSGATRLPLAESGPQVTPRGVRLPPGQTTTGSGALMAELERSGSRPPSRLRVALVAFAVVGGGGLLGGLAAYKSLGTSTAPPAEEAPRPAEAPRAPEAPRHAEAPPAPPEAPVTAPQPRVTFAVDSEPRGARVTAGGQQLGTTPFSFTVARTGAAPEVVQLDFALDGYAPGSASAEGLEGTVPVRAVLTRKKAGPPPPAPARPAPRPRQKKQPEGYKDDPYQ
jgi:serine/threonine-protein kinase